MKNITESLVLLAAAALLWAACWALDGGYYAPCREHCPFAHRK